MTNQPNNTPLTPEMQEAKDYVMCEVSKLTSRINELEIENGKLRGAVTMASNSIERRGILNKTLLELLHTQVTKRAHDQNAHPINTEAIWQRYCEENGIKYTPYSPPHHPQ